MSATTFNMGTIPAAAFESLLPKLISVLELAQNPQGLVTPEAKRALVQATNEFKDSLVRAEELANTLPGGEITIQEQDEVIRMLEQMRERKVSQLAAFAGPIGLPKPKEEESVSTSTVQHEHPMDVDSAASTPGA